MNLPINEEIVAVLDDLERWRGNRKRKNLETASLTRTMILLRKLAQERGIDIWMRPQVKETN